MVRKILFFAVLIALIFVLFPVNTSAQNQYGKNRVQYRESEWKIYRTPHFAIRHTFDLKDTKQASNMVRIISLLENQYRFYSSAEVFDYELTELLPVIVFKTHSDLEGSAIGSPSVPEGVGAYVDWARVRMVIKADFEPQLFERIVAHELVHQFQMKISQRSVIGKMLGMSNRPLGFIESGAEYITSLRMPHTRGDIRDDSMRMMAADIHTMPPWEVLMSNGANAYVAWKMAYDFVDVKCGPDTGVKLHVQGMKTNIDMGILIYDLCQGKLGNPNINSNLFNQEFFDHYTELYEADRISRPKPYQENDNFKGRNITPDENPYPMLCQALSPDGKEMACFTIHKNAVALVTFPILEEPVYVPNDKKGQRKAEINKRFKRVIVNLTPQMVPIPYEYLVNPLETWPKNGGHMDWSKDNRIAFFARTGRDHMLYIVDPKEEGKILQKISLELDQAFSPKFSPDSKKVYFSAASNSVFDLYSVDLETKEVINLTNDERYDTGPAISPDGTKIAYVGNDGDFSHLFMLDLVDGSKKQITFNRYNDIEPNWSDSGNQLVFVSDEADKIFHPYTLDLVTNTRSRRLNLFGGGNNPMFARNSEDTIYYTVYRTNDTFRGQVYRNHEIFEAKLKEPITTQVVVDNHESNIYTFNSDRFFEFELDPNQVNKPRKPPEDWVFEASDVQVGGTRYLGLNSLYTSSYIHFSNLMETKHHFGQFVMYSSFLRAYAYSYLDQSKRTSKVIDVHYNDYPWVYNYYDNNEQRPKGSFLINYGYWRDAGASGALLYPLSKWSRVEFISGFRNTKVDFGGLTSEVIDYYKDDFSDIDKQLFPFIDGSNGSSLFTGVALVRDTVIGSSASQGPFHGNAFRVEAVAAPPAGNKLKGYVTASVQARIYRGLTSGGGVVLALRGDVKTTTSKSGEIVVAGGSDMFRGRQWGTIIGNEIVYGSAELRFPLADGVVFPGGMGIGPFRGLLFGDAGVARFRGENFPAQKVSTLGAGVEFKPFQLVWARQPNGKFAPSFYYTFGW